MIKKSHVIYWILCAISGFAGGLLLNKWCNLLWVWTGNDPV